MKKIFTLVALILVLSMLSSSLLPLSALAPADAIGADDLDFSDPERSTSEEFSPSELLSMLLPEGSFEESEARYLDLSTDSFLLINKSFSNERVNLHFDGEDIIKVSALPYEYVAENGHTVTWTPVRATYRTESVELTVGRDGDYIADIHATPTEEASVVSVEYSCSISLSSDVVDYVINRAYRDATAAKLAIADYEEVLAAYTEKYLLYQAYLEDLGEYEDAMEEYEAYLSAKAEYERELEAYNKYLSRLAQYERDLASYNSYLAALNKYNIDKAEYDRVYAENQDAINDYLDYYKKLNEINARMYAMESIYMRPDDGMNPLFNALQNKELVVMFERYKDILSMFGVSTATVDRLSAEADELNDLLILYSEERKKPAPAAFNFYVEHYDEICTKFNHLYDSMIEIMKPAIFVKMGAKLELDYKDNPAEGEYKKWRILNVLSQVYLVCRALDDTKNTDGTWSFYTYDGKERTYAFPELLAPNVIISDTNNSSPEGLVWPEEVPPVILPPLPQMPTEVAKPLPPAVVDQPEEVDEVTRPTAPDVVADPGAAPSAPEDFSIYEDIIADLDAGILTERTASPDGAELSFTHSVEKLVAFDNPPIITVYGPDPSIPLSQYTTEADSVLTPPDISPERPSTERYVYTFEGWSLSPDTYLPVDGHVVTKDVSIYAYYSRADRLYKITWITPKGEVESYFKYGVLPTFDGDLSKDPTETLVYNFDGWSPALKQVTGDASYTAKYTDSERKYTIIWNYPGKSVTELYPFGRIPTPPTVPIKYISGSSLFMFTGWDSKPSVTNADKVYTALYEETLLAEDGSESGVELKESSSGFEITTAGNTVSAGELIALAARSEKKVNLNFGEISLSMDKDAVDSLSKGGAYRISLVTNPETRSASGEITSLSLQITDQNGAPVRLSRGEVRVSIPTARESVTNYTLYAIRDGGAREKLSYMFADGEISFIAKPNLTFKFIQLYSVTVQSVENGETMLDKLVYEAGSTVTPTYYPAISFEAAEVSILRADTQKTTVLEDKRSFVMPECDVTLIVSYKKLSYTVRFVVNGEEVSSAKYEIGKTPVPPKITEEYTDGEYRYVFAGWSPLIGAVTEDVTYTAKFNTFLGPKTTIDTGDAWDAFTKQTIIPAIAIGITSIAAIFGVIVLLVSIRKKRKKKKANINKTE